MTDLSSELSFRRNRQLRKAVYQNKALSRAGFSERLFALLFTGLVYPQIWEDPEVDMAAMQLGEGHRVVTIASGGCNILAYLTRSPAQIDAVDLNPHHVALNRLKLARRGGLHRLLPGTRGRR
jgi:S-adenosylmethionine-diacylglycerol 3-amino-3-carboxypropyl transferase